MNSRRLICIGLTAALALSSLGLSACGKQGALERPAPLLGPGSKRAQREAAARGAAEANQNSSATSQTNGDYSQPSDGAKDPALTPMRSSPPAGVSNDPFGGRSGGVLPDPYADPNRAPR
ncbi:MAG: hypothetical protein WDN45_00625 [Caulobacteraceae bacterium]